MTNSREIYEKFSLLNFSPEVLLRNVKSIQVERIIKTINKDGRVLDFEHIDNNYILVKKVGPINFSVYMKGGLL